MTDAKRICQLHENITRNTDTPSGGKREVEATFCSGMPGGGGGTKPGGGGGKLILVVAAGGVEERVCG